MTTYRLPLCFITTSYTLLRHTKNLLVPSELWEKVPVQPDGHENKRPLSASAVHQGGGAHDDTPAPQTPPSTPDGTKADSARAWPHLVAGGAPASLQAAATGPPRNRLRVYDNLFLLRSIQFIQTAQLAPAGDRCDRKPTVHPLWLGVHFSHVLRSAAAPLVFYS